MEVSFSGWSLVWGLSPQIRPRSSNLESSVEPSLRASELVHLRVIDEETEAQTLH